MYSTNFNAVYHFCMDSNDQQKVSKKYVSAFKRN